MFLMAILYKSEETVIKKGFLNCSANTRNKSANQNLLAMDQRI
jgi:hypothetical protein